MGFHCVTPSTHEVNTLYDLPGQKLRRKGELLRLRKYGEHWRLTHKAKAKAGQAQVARRAGDRRFRWRSRWTRFCARWAITPVFVYEKFRSEWSDGKGHVVLDHTPIGDIAEIEGKPRWIDSTARALGVQPSRLHHEILC